MERIFLLVILMYLVHTIVSLRCVATGDPHYTSFFGRRFDILRPQGDFVLAKYPKSDFELQSRLNYAPGGRVSLQMALILRLDDNVISSTGGRGQTNARRTLKINGKRLNAPFGRKVLHKGLVVNTRMINGRTMEMKITSPKQGVNLVITARNAGSFLYHDVVLDVPNQWKNDMRKQSLCGIQHHLSYNNYLVKKADRLFHGMIQKPQKVLHRLSNVKWESQQMKRKAEKHCKSKGLKGDLLKDCMYDVRLAGGNLKFADGYSNTNESIEELKRMSKRSGDGYLHMIYKIVYKMKKGVRDTLERAKKVYAGLKKQYKIFKDDSETYSALAKVGQLLKKKNDQTSKLTSTMKLMGDVIKKQFEIVKKDMKRQKEVIEINTKELKGIETTLGYVGALIMERRKKGTGALKYKHHNEK